MSALIILMAALSGSGAILHGQDPPEIKATAIKPDGILEFETDGIVVPEYLELDAPFQSGVRCGPNALYVILKMLGKDVSYDEVLERVPLTNQGSNLQELVDAAQQFGIHCEARKNVSPDDLQRMPKPVIVHLKNMGEVRPGTATDEAPQDHFTVVTSYNAESDFYVTIDTTNLLFALASPKSLARNMSGYCVLPSDGALVDAKGESNSTMATFGYVALGTLAAANLIPLALLLKRRRRS